MSTSVLKKRSRFLNGPKGSIAALVLRTRHDELRWRPRFGCFTAVWRKGEWVHRWVVTTKGIRLQAWNTVNHCWNRYKSDQTDPQLLEAIILGGLETK